MAQLVARLHGMEEVWGSNPHSSTSWPLLVADLRSASARAAVFSRGATPGPPRCSRASAHCATVAQVPGLVSLLFCGLGLGGCRFLSASAGAAVFSRGATPGP